MASQIRLRTFFAVFALSVGFAGADIEVDNWDRLVSLRTQVVVTSDTVSLRNTGTEPASAFQWCTLKEHAPRLAYLSMVEKAEDGVPSYQTRQPPAVDVSADGVACFELPIGKPGSVLAAKATATLMVQAVFTKLQVPFPKSITQEEPQRVLFSGSLHAVSPYRVTKQILKLETFNSDVISYTEVEGVKKSGRTLSYGPFSNLQPFSKEPLQVHFVNNAPFAVAKSVERVLDVSLLGKFDIEERYQVTHGGAKLKGSWSRLDYQQDPYKFAQASFRELSAEVPGPAEHLYFRDAIGNVSTSAIRDRGNSKQVALLPRVPLFGGWSTDFSFGFSLPIAPLLRRTADGRRELFYGFGPHVRGLVVDELTVRVQLPAGAHTVTAETAVESELSFEPKYTFLSKAGRTVVVLRATNVVDAANQPFIIRYALPPLAWAREPALWAGSLAAVLGALYIFVTSDFSLVREGARSAARSRGQASAVAQRASAIFAERRQALTGLDGAFDRRGVSPEDVMVVKKHTDAVLRSTAEKLSDAHRKLDALAGSSKGARLQALIDQDAAAAESSLKLFERRVEQLQGGGSSMDAELNQQRQRLTILRSEIAAAAEALAASV